MLTLPLEDSILTVILANVNMFYFRKRPYEKNKK